MKIQTELRLNPYLTIMECERTGDCLKQYDMIWKTLPNEVSFIVLEFCGLVKNRNGKYIYQISKTDVRYSVLQTIPKWKDSHGGKVYIGICIYELRVDIKKTINDIKYHFVIFRTFANDSQSKCTYMTECIYKWKKNTRMSKGIYNYI